MNLSPTKLLAQIVPFLLSVAILRSICVLAAVTMGLSAAAAPSGWDLVWNDEFDGNSLDTAKWDPIHWLTPFNNERQAYHPDQVTVSGGNLVLTATDQPLGGKAYRSGKVESMHVQQYGRWEVRAKLPGTQGTWPAIWLLPDTSQYGWPTQGEIDILENRGNQPFLTSSAFHYGPNVAGHQYVFDENQMHNGGQAENYHEEFHTYAVEWDAGRLRFFVDDVNYYTVHNDQVGGFLASQTAPMELNLNVAVGGDFLGSAQPNGSSVWPQQMLIDYVRVYERDANPPPPTFDNGSFEEQGGSLAQWTTFGNKLPNVVTHHEVPALDGSESLKLFGQFNGSLNFSGIEQAINVQPGDSISAMINTYIRSTDSIAGTANRVEAHIDYYREAGARYGSNKFIGTHSVTIADGTSANDSWVPHEITHSAPADAVEARLAIVFIQPGNEAGAVYIDNVSFASSGQIQPADFDHDGDVDHDDLSLWKTGYGTSSSATQSMGDSDADGDVDGLDFIRWQRQFSTTPSLSSLERIPEPSSEYLAAIGFTLLLLRAF